MIPILDILNEYDKYKGIKDALAGSKGAVSVFGLSEAHRVHMLSALYNDMKSSMMVVMPNENDCVRYEELFSAFGISALHFPAKTQLVSSSAIAVSGGTESQRTSQLIEIMHSKKSLVLVSCECLMQRLAPKDELRCAIITVKVGDECDMQILIGRLADTGYERVELCSGKNTFSVRGGRIDVFPSNSKMPVRIEFFGDEIDSVRSYNPEDQRSLEMLDSCEIYPATEMPVSSERLKEVIHRLRRIKGGKTIADELEAGTNSYRLNQLVGLLYDNPSYVSDYMKDDTCFVLNEPLRIKESGDNEYMLFSESVKTIIEENLGGGYLWELMMPPFDALSALPQKKMLMLSNFASPVSFASPKAVYNIDAPSVTVYMNNDELFLHDIATYSSNDYAVAVYAGRSVQTVKKILSSADVKLHETDEIKTLSDIRHGQITIVPQSLPLGFEYREMHFACITENELLGLSMHRKQAYSPKPKAKKQSEVLDLSSLSVGDFVVHEVHGIGRYLGIKEVTINNKRHDYIEIQYAGADTLCISCDQIDKLQRYVGTGDGVPKLSKLGTNEWARTVSRVRSSVKKLAFDLVALYGERMSRKGYAFSPDTEMQKLLEASFPYDETPDQLTCIADVKRDMESDRIMDRLICGDVGFGKTEIAIRAAFKAVMDCKQVAFLVPTTILAYQHYNTVSARFAQFGVRVDYISRFKTPNEIKTTLKKLENGEIDVIIGTHRLLSKDVKFFDLGLLIIDEEQRFGVGHKETIKEMKKTVDVLTMTATPIPRTMHMSLIGIRDISLLETPPKQRYPVQTFVAEYSDVLVRDAVLKEVARGGQVFVLYNNVQDMPRFYSELCELIPEARISFAHGQMRETELEKTMLDFIDRKFDVLVSSTIIENGIDVPNANTLIVIDADNLGLAQMYQLRGRVGRSNRIGFAYFTFAKGKVLTEVASKRLGSIAQFTQLGSGVKIAMRDLQIRGAGDILGAQQSGHMAEIGYEMYRRLVSEAVAEARGYVKPKQVLETRIDAPIDAYIPKNYVENEDLRLEIYEKISKIQNEEDYLDVSDELIDRFGDPPKPVVNLLNVAVAKVVARECYVTYVGIQPVNILLRFADNAPYNIEKIVDFTKRHGASISNDNGMYLTIPEKNADKSKVCANLKSLLQKLKNCLEETV